MQSMGKKKKTKTIIITILAMIIGFIYIFPVLWLILSSLKPSNELYAFPLKLFPSKLNFDIFIKTWNDMNFVQYTKNTLFVTVVATTATVFISAMCGFALAKYRYKWLDVLFVCFLATTMLPAEVIMAPNFEVIRILKLYNNLWGIILPTIGTLTGIFMMRQFFITVPDALLEAARIDGASEWRIFIKLMLPLAKPVIAILTIFSFRWRWNDYIWPLIVIDDPKKYTLQLALRNLVGAKSIDWSTLLAASVISMIPIVIIFIIFQKYIMNGYLNSGMK